MFQKKIEIFPIRKSIFSQLSIVVAWRLKKEPKIYVGVDSTKFVSVRKHTRTGLGHRSGPREFRTAPKPTLDLWANPGKN